MIMYDLRHYLKTHKKIMLTELAYHFDKDPLVIQSMLQLWIKKGQLKELEEDLSCKKGCNKCDESIAVQYVWQEKVKPLLIFSVKD